MIEWWMKNSIAIIALVLPATVVLLWLSPAIHAGTICKSGDPCIREWFSALSGWVAGAAAFFTIRKMNQQRQDSDRHQRENVEIQIMGRLSLARSMRSIAQDISSSAKSVQAACIEIEKGDLASKLGVGAISAMVNQTLQPETMAFVENYDQEIGISPLRMDYVVLLANGLQNWAAAYDDARATGNIERAKVASQQLISFCGIAERTFTDIAGQTTAFIERWQAKIAA